MNMEKRIISGTCIAVMITVGSIMGPSYHPSGEVDPASTVSPFPTSGTVPVVTVSPSRALKKSAKTQMSGDAVNAPYGDAQRVLAEARIIAENAAKLNAAGSTGSVSSTGGVVRVAKVKPKPKPPVVTTIKGYVFCGKAVKAAQKCIDRGKLTLYYPSGVPTLAGHNYMGWYWMDDLPNGRVVKIQSGSLKGTYKVYGHAKVYDKKFPKSGRGAAVALQTCEGKGIGFSFLRRI